MQKPKAYIGIDPGASGAAVLISENGIDVFDWQGVSHFANEIRGWSLDYNIVMAVLEKVSARPGQGVSSMFNFGTTWGMIQGVFAGVGIPYALLTPQNWQKGLVMPTDGADSKERSLAVARRMFPACDWIGRKKDHNRSDALLMAHVCRNRFSF